MNTINERLAALVEDTKLGVPAVAKKADGMDPNTLRKAMKGPSKPSIDTTAAILRAFPKYSPDWLLLGAGPMLRQGANPIIAPLPKDPEPAQPIARPAPIETQPGQVDFVNKYITNLEQQVQAAAEREERLNEQIRILLGKSPGNRRHAATEVHAMVSSEPEPRMTIRRWGAAAQCVVRNMYPGRASVSVTPVYASR